MTRCVQQTIVYLDAEQATELDRVAAHQGISRSELNRRLLDRGLQDAFKVEKIDLAAIESTAGAVPDFEPFARVGGASVGDGRGAHMGKLRNPARE